MEEKTKEKRGGYGVGNKIKMTWNVRGVNKFECRRGAPRWGRKT